MKISKRIASFVLMFLMSLSLFSSNVSAATGYQGYAVYRDGAFMGLAWHAGIMDTAYSTEIFPVVHHSGKGYVKWDSWDNFINGDNKFKGVYKPKSDPISSARDLFVTMGRKLKDEQISYNIFYQVYYDTSSSGNWVGADEVISMRCDGVVEFIYEWYGHRVYGSDTYWDVTKSSFEGREHHANASIKPSTQKDYLTLVTINEPTN